MTTFTKTNLTTSQTATMAPDKLKSRFRQVVKHQFCLAAGWIVVLTIAVLGLALS